MRTLRVMEHVSLDGIVQHSADDDGFPYADWTAPYRSPEGREAVAAVQGARFDLLIGRRTYDLWSGFWPKAPASTTADAINAAVKHVVTHRPASLEWGPFAAIGPEAIAGIRQLKASDGPDLVLWGSSTLTSLVLGQGLADELILILSPVLLGTGKRLFASGTPARSLSLTSTQATPTGVVLSRYRVAGPLQAG